jgi:hypothetical protein
MVEFGAGGAITHTETEPAPAGENNENNAENAETPAPQEEGPGTAAQAQLAQAQAANRRKRRAKGWFCPVCRQRKFILVLILPITDRLSVSLYFTPQDYDDPATKGRD